MRQWKVVLESELELNEGNDLDICPKCNKRCLQTENSLSRLNWVDCSGFHTLEPPIQLMTAWLEWQEVVASETIVNIIWTPDYRNMRMSINDQKRTNVQLANFLKPSSRARSPTFLKLDIVDFKLRYTIADWSCSCGGHWVVAKNETSARLVTLLLFVCPHLNYVFSARLYSISIIYAYYITRNTTLRLIGTNSFLVIRLTELMVQ